jgi:high-affinity nickel permease
MRLLKIAIYEFLLVFASVAIFRSLWMIADRIPWMNQDSGILGSLIAGIIITVISLIRLNTIIDEKREK